MIFHDQRRLDNRRTADARRIFRREKCAAQFAERRQFAIQNHFAIGEVHPLAPRRIGLPLFINGNAFAQPARHPVLRLGQRDDVTELVPQNVFPVCWIRRLRRRAVRRDDGTETDAEITGIARHAQTCARQNLFARRKYPRSVRSVSSTPYLRVKRGPCPLQQIQAPTVAVKSGFVRRHVDDEIRVGKRLIFRHLIVQGDQIVTRRHRNHPVRGPPRPASNLHHPGRAATNPPRVARCAGK